MNITFEACLCNNLFVFELIYIHMDIYLFTR